MSPQRPDLILSTDIPDVEFGVLVRYGLYVETDSRYRLDVVVEFELVEDRCGR